MNNKQTCIVLVLMLCITLSVYGNSRWDKNKIYRAKKTLKNNKIIWLYWDTPNGKKKPYHIQLCHDLVKKYNPGFKIVILNKDNVHEWVYLPSYWYDLEYIAHKADFVRIQILYLYGGIYIDSDMVSLDSLEPIYKKLKTHDFVAYEYVEPLHAGRVDVGGSRFTINDIMDGKAKNTYRVFIGFLACRPKTELFRQWLEKVDSNMRERNTLESQYINWKKKDKKNTVVMWHGFGRTYMNPLLIGLAMGRKMKYLGIPAEYTVAPIKAYARSLYSEDVDLDLIIKPKVYQPFITLYNSFMPELHDLITPDNIGKCDALICKLFRHALEK